MDGPHAARSQSVRLKAIEPTVDTVASAGFGLIVRDLARALGAEIALLAVPGPAYEDVEVLAAWGATASGEISLAAEGFLGRALEFRRAGLEPIGDPPDSLGEPKSGAEITHALGVPVEPLVGTAGVLCAAFAGDPSPDPATTLWLAESYARLASLCLHDQGALDGLLSGGRLDGLTGCLTQAAFLQELERELARSERHRRPLSCSFIDLDRFKRVNDRYGHLHGSRVLANIGAVLRAEIRGEDTLGRYGGDEFVVLLPDTAEAAAVELSRRLRAKIARTMVNLPHDPIDASIGVAQWRPGTSLQALLWAADEALLAAKASGGGTTIGASALAPVTVVKDSPSVHDVLDVTAQFDKTGGASVELAAWELDVELAQLVSAWSRAIKQGLLQPAGTDASSGEEMWRLSDQGRHARNRPST
ncbi:MAG TPA: GGDEF domain-containing protein [Solirubrobacteraceae bacterium]|nr:GGDEF domain-containing protein [Solirubrobacteraceae bacterium]